MISTRAEAWIAIRRPYPDELEWAAENNARVANSLRELPSTLPRISSTLSKVEISEGFPDLPALKSLQEQLNGRNVSLFAFHRITCQVKLHDDDAPYPEGLIDSIAASQLEEAISVAVILIQITRPGSLSLAGGVVLIDNRVFSKVSGQRILYEMHSSANRKMNWPQVDDLRLEQVSAWAADLGAFSSSIARSRVQRTFAALTHALSLPPTHSGETLFRAMQGLEAFFSDGIGDLRRQLSEKCQLWLGPSGEVKNVVGHLYDLRSAYVHGSANLTYSFSLHDAWEEDQRSTKKLSEAVDFAVRLLVATIQKCIADQVFDLQWKYEYEMRAPSPSADG